MVLEEADRAHFYTGLTGRTGSFAGGFGLVLALVRHLAGSAGRSLPDCHA